MIRLATLVSVVCIVFSGSPAILVAQYRSGTPVRDPRTRRVLREQAVAYVGPTARDFVETQGDEAAAALLTCSKPVAIKLVQFYAGGDLAKLPRPRDLLLAIAKPGHGDDIALWAIGHASELADRDSFDAYLISPLEYALSLKKLEAGAAEARARRLSWTAMTAKRMEEMSGQNRLGIVAAICLLAGIALLIWRRRKAGLG